MAKRPGKPSRPRTERRAAERDARELVRARERLAALEPGGSPARPIDVPSAAVIDGRARATPCIQCGGELRVEDDAAAFVDGRAQRVVNTRCVSCHAPRLLHFRLPAAPS
jgi:hypothetical protein